MVAGKGRISRKVAAVPAEKHPWIVTGLAD
jgi:hypothetical protein